jgi:transposase
MDGMDCFPEMKGHYIVMDNAPIHTAKKIDELITRRGYMPIYLPPYSPALNPIEQLWAIVKNKIKRSKFEDKEDLVTRITEACTFKQIFIYK